jgi:uncharacterized protein YecE (DUF72 family)
MAEGGAEGSLWRIGCAGFTMKLSEYFQRFNLVEVQESFFDPPTERTLQRWRRQAPEGFAFSIRAWQLVTHPPSYAGYQRIRRPWETAARDRFGSFQATEQTQWAWQLVERTARILDAKAIVFHTPASFTPTRENKGNLVRFFDSIERGNYHLVWEPDGIWEASEMEALCRECGLIAAVDPLLGRPLAGRAFYFRIREKTRGRGPYTEDDFFDIHRAAPPADGQDREGFFIWHTPDAARDGSRFAKWLASEGFAQSAGWHERGGKGGPDP